MRILILFLCATVGLALADQVVMKNGDRVSGAIIKKDAGKLTIKSVHFGVVTLAWDEVASLRSDNVLTVVRGAGVSEAPVVLQGAGLKDVVAIRNAEEQKAYLRMLRPKLTDFWGMTGNVGFAGASGNARTHTLTVPLNFVRETRADKITASFNLIRSAATVNGVSSQTASAVRGGWAYNRTLAPRVFVSAVNSYEYDRFQNLDLRAVFGGGVGTHAWKRERGFVDFTVGGDYNHESFTAGARQFAELYWGDNLGWKMGKRLSFTQSYRMFNHLTDAGMFRQNADLAVSMGLTKFLTWNASASDRYVTNPAAVGLRRNDFLYSTGVGFKFAR